MYVKSLGFIIALTISLIASSAYTQSRAPTGSVEDLQSSDHSNGSIVIISEEKTDIPDTFACSTLLLTRVVARYSLIITVRPINPNDKDLRQAEQRACVEIAMNTRDGD